MNGWPYDLNQLAGQAGPGDGDGRPDDVWNDCGPTSVAAVLGWAFGQAVEPDAIRDALYGDGRKGYTYMADLYRYLGGVGLRATLVTETSGADQWVQSAIRAGGPVLALTKEPAGYNHICPYTGFDEVSVVRHQVLGGGREVLTWPDFLGRFAGWLIVVVPPGP